MASTSSSGQAAARPLSDAMVASLRLELAWLDVRTSPSVSSTASDPEPALIASRRASSSQESASLAERRLSGQSGSRPGLFRRRSKSLDEVAAQDVRRSRSESSKPCPSSLSEVDGTTSTSKQPRRDPVITPASPSSPLPVANGSAANPYSSMSYPGPVAAASSLEEGEQGAARGSDRAERLARWVESARTSSDRPSAQDGSAPDVAHKPPQRPTRVESPGRLALPPATPFLPPTSGAQLRPAYAPALPSPLSTCSYTSADEQSGSPEGLSQTGFPFPTSPRGLSPVAESPASDLAARPPIQTHDTDETVSSIEAATIVSTPHAVGDTVSAVSDQIVPLAVRNRSVANSVSASHVSSTLSLASSPKPSSSSDFSFDGANAFTRRPSIASTSSASLMHSSGAPRTPPDVQSAASYLYGSGAAEMAWHEVLSARYGSEAAQGAAGYLRKREDSFGYNGLVAAADSPSGGVVSSPDGRPESIARRSSLAAPSTHSPRGQPGHDVDGCDSGRPWGGCDLMGSAAGGGYAMATREKLAALLAKHAREIPFTPEDESLVHFAEYGALNSRSSGLVVPLLDHFAGREAVAFDGDVTPAASNGNSARRPSSPSSHDLDELVSYQVTHVDLPSSDLRCLAEALENDPNSYLRGGSRTQNAIPLEGRVFSSFASRPHGIQALPRKSVSAGWSAMCLHWPKTARRYRTAPATIAHGEMMSFLSARASEYKPGGVLVLAYIARSEEAALAAQALTTSPSVNVATPSSVGTGSSSPSSNGSPIVRANADIWSYLIRLLGKAIQRLVSTGLLKPQVARQLLALPLHPRTPRQTAASLRASAHSWDVLDSEMVSMSHPAWKGVQHGTVGVESWADHTVQMLKVFWEDELRTILRDALGSRGTCEWTLDCLWTVVKEKVEDMPPQPLDVEVQFLALRRRQPTPASSPTGVTA